jgi:hypothetical protein
LEPDVIKFDKTILPVLFSRKQILRKKTYKKNQILLGFLRNTLSALKLRHLKKIFF